MAQTSPAPLFFGDIVHGVGSGQRLQSTFQLFNAQTSQSINATIKMFKDDGSPYGLGLQDAQTGTAVTQDSVGVFTVAIPPRGLKVFTTTGSGSIAAGWAQIMPSASGLNGNVFFQQFDGSGNLTGQAGVANELPASVFTILVEKSAFVNTGMALANPSLTASASLSMQFIAGNGIAGPVQNTTLGQLQHFAKFFDEFPSFAGIGNGFGTLLITSNAPLVGVALRIDHGQLTTLPLLASNALAPTITSLSPNHGPIGTTVTIAGTNFNLVPGNNRVTFNGVVAGVISGTATSLVTTVPANATTGPVVVSVDINASNSVTFTLDNDILVPVITSLNPPGAAVGSPTTSVEINGRNFSTGGTATVQFGSFQPPLQVLNSTRATMTLTAAMLANVGTFPVVFVNPGTLFGGTNSNIVNFIVSNQVQSLPPSLTSISPNSGFPGQTVTILGTNFDPLVGSNNIVRFNGTTATQIASFSSTQIVVVVPAGATTGSVTVTSNGLTSNSLPFTVTSAPASTLVQVGTTPAGVAYDPVKNQAIVSNFDDHTLTFIDVGTGTVLNTIAAGGANPFGIDIQGRQAVVAINDKQTQSTYVVNLVDLDSRTVVKNVRVVGLPVPPFTPFNVVFDGNTGNVVTTDGTARALVFPVNQGNTVGPLAVIGINNPYDVAIYNGPGGIRWALFTQFAQDLVFIWDLVNNTAIGNIPFPELSRPQGIAVNSATNTAVVANNLSGTVSIIDLNTRTIVGTIQVGLGPNYVAIDPTRNRAVVTNSNDGTISVINLNTRTVIATLSTQGSFPLRVALNPSANLAIVANSQSNNVGLISLP